MRTIKGILVSVILCYSITTFGQQIIYVSDDPRYISNIKVGDSLYENERYIQALPYYKKALQISKKSVRSNFRLATCYYKNKQIRQSFDILTSLMDSHWVAFCHEIGLNTFDISDEELGLFKADDHWRIIDSICTVKAKNYRGSLNFSLMKEMKEIRARDQSIRQKLQEVAERHGWDSKQVQSLNDSIRAIDSINLQRVIAIFDQYGYPGKTLVGETQSTTAFLVIQHSPMETIEKYFPLIEEAAYKGEMPLSYLALMVDRIRVYKGQKQLYGTQYMHKEDGGVEYYPIEDEANLEKRRKEMGMIPFSEHLKRLGHERPNK